MLQHNHFLPKIKGPTLFTLLIFFSSFSQAFYCFYALIFALSFEVNLFMLVFGVGLLSLLLNQMKFLLIWIEHGFLSCIE
jgi:hypothetical protein